ncbi:MAG TPA: hypothetical protein VHV53_05565 [Solirubrobacterales bacterium]|jgi:hypothetical protein|nr:hypothetical protein [Solirubrobacterales bacterium]
MSAAEAETTGTAAEPDDADDLRGYHFRELIHKWTTWAWIVGVTLLSAAVGLIIMGAFLGVLFLVIAFLVSLYATWKVADVRAADDFFHVYAKSRDLVLGGKTSLPAATPLLRKGDDQYAERTLTGALAPAVEGTLAIYIYITETTDSRGNRERTEHKFTLGMSDVPECADHVPELYCQRKFGLRALEKFEDVFRHSKERVELESEALDDKYEIFCAKGQDANWLRRLFSPTFIVWLTESAPEKFAFELVDGRLVAYVHGHKEDAADLDKIAVATAAVASRLREESTEPAGDAG